MSDKEFNNFSNNYSADDELYQNNSYKQKKRSRKFLILLTSISIIFSVCFILFCVVSLTKSKDFISPNEPDFSSSELILNDKPNEENLLTAAEVFEKTHETVVSVTSYNPNITDEENISYGSGIVMTEDGYIITNSHVIQNSKNNSVSVILNNGKDFSASVIGFDEKTDIAVLKISYNGLKCAEFGNSDNLKVGDWVLSLGNPSVEGTNFSSTLTRGMVSALDRLVNLSNGDMKYIQTDAAINPGSSGGALLNMYGQVVGINASKVNVAGVEGINFAIPINTAKKVVDDIIANGSTSNKVRLGITGRVLTNSQAQLYGVPQGIVIAFISDESNLKYSNDVDEAQVNDIITKIDNVSITSFDELSKQLNKYNPGDTVTLTIYRSATNTERAKTFEVHAVLLEDTESS